MADTLGKHLAATERSVTGELGRSGMAIVDIGTPDGRDQLILDPGRIEPQISNRLFRIVDRNVEQPGTGSVPLTLKLGSSTYEVEASVSGLDGPVVLQFSDGSTLPIGRDIVRVVSEDVGVADEVEHVTISEVVEVDAGGRLGEPFSVNEFASLEGILGWLWEAAATDQLTAGQQVQILTIAQLIEDERRDTVPGETKREVMVRLVQRGLKYTVREMPKDALALVKLGEILRDSGWIETLGQLF